MNDNDYDFITKLAFFLIRALPYILLFFAMIWWIMWVGYA